MRLNKITWIALIVLIVFGGAFFAIKSMKLPDVQIDNVNLEQIPDGSYLGEYARGPVKVAVEVSVLNNQIENIAIREHQCGLGRKAEKIVAEVLGKQTLQLDAISGATLSSNAILKAVQVALDEGTK